MKTWPVPSSYSKSIPIKPSPGIFWGDRGDRFHCGVDIYAPKGSEVISIEDGIVEKISIFTSPTKIPYWNETKFIAIKNATSLLCIYCELNDSLVSQGDQVKSGQLIGHVGQPLNSKKINNKCPIYIQKLKKEGNLSMLHFELYKAPIEESIDWPIGNCFQNIPPPNLIDPTGYLLSTLRTAE